MLDRRVNELFDLGEGHDFVELGRDLGLAHAHDRAIEKNVFAPRELGMKAGSNFQQRSDTAMNQGAPFGWPGNARENLAQRTLASAIAPDHADDFTVLHLKRNVTQRPEGVRVGISSTG